MRIPLSLLRETFKQFAKIENSASPHYFVLLDKMFFVKM